MAANDTMTSMDAALKTRWPQKRITTEVYEDCPLLGLMPKAEFEGKNMVVAVRYAGQQGRSADFSKALGNRTASGQVAFTVTTVKDYATGGIDGETAETLDQGDVGSLAGSIDDQMETSTQAIKRSLCVGVWGDGTGIIGQVGSVAAGVITLKAKEAVINFEVGQVIGASSAKTSGSERSGTGTITNVDPDAGKITYSGTITSIAADDYLWIDGDFLSKLSGIQSWITLADPTSTAFFGVDRTVHKTRLAGVRFGDYAGKPILQTLTAGLTYCARFNSYPESVFLNPTDMIKVKMELLGKTVIERSASPDMPTVGYDGIVLPGYNRKIKVYEDASAPAGYAAALKLSTWKLRTRGPAPKYLMKDGLRIRADGSNDAYIWRLGYYGNMMCENPLHNAWFTL